MPGPEAMIGRWLGIKIGRYINEKRNTRIGGTIKDNAIVIDSSNALKTYGHDEVFQSLWNTDVSNPESNNVMKENLLEQMKTYPYLLLLWADACLKSYKIDKALLCSEVATSLEPDNSEAWNVRGIILAVQNNNLIALNCFEKAVKIDPSNQKAVKNLQLAKKGKKDWVLKKYSLSKKAMRQAR